MENVWKGKMLPGFTKHRDFAHKNFFEHEMDNGAYYEVDPVSVPVDHNPIDFRLFDPARTYYFVDFTLHSGTTYPFLVPSEPDKSRPNEKRIGQTVNEYVTNPVENGRDWYDYIDLEDEKAQRHPRVLARLEEEPFLNQKRPRNLEESESEGRLPLSLDEIFKD